MPVAMTNDNSDDRIEPMFTLGDRMQKARRHAGISGTEMGQLLAVFNNGKPFRHSTISAWERDQNQPRHMLDILVMWAELTGVSEVWLLEGAGLTLRRQLSLVADSGGQEEFIFDPPGNAGGAATLILVP